MLFVVVPVGLMLPFWFQTFVYCSIYGLEKRHVPPQISIWWSLWRHKYASPQTPYWQVQHTYTDTNIATLDVIRPEHFGMEGAGLPSNESVEAPNIVNVAKVAACAMRFCWVQQCHWCVPEKQAEEQPMHTLPDWKKLPEALIHRNGGNWSEFCFGHLGL